MLEKIRDKDEIEVVVRYLGIEKRSNAHGDIGDRRQPMIDDVNGPAVDSGNVRDEFAETTGSVEHTLGTAEASVDERRNFRPNLAAGTVMDALKTVVVDAA